MADQRRMACPTTDAELNTAGKTLKKLMRLKFQSLSKAHEAIIDAADIDAIDQALERILTADTPDAVFA